METSTFTLAILLMLATPGARGHGEDKPGPHGGEIRMPGAFHTELVIERDPGKKTGGAKIYLLDMESKNPVVKDSRVKISIDGAPPTDCPAADDHFRCPLGVGTEITVTAKRAGQQGNAVTYRRAPHR